MDWLPGADKFVYVDSATYGIDVFDVERDGRGKKRPALALTNRRRAVTVPADYEEGARALSLSLLHPLLLFFRCALVEPEVDHNTMRHTCGLAGGTTMGGVPDGITLDAAGHVWCVLGESGHVVQYSLETGQQIASVRLPVQRPTACTFGGSDLSALYVSTREEVGEGPSPHAGGLFVAHVPGAKGAAAAMPLAA